MLGVPAPSPPSPALRAWLREAIAARVGAGAGASGDWPREVMREHEVLLVDGDNATLWFLGLDGALYSVDTDRVAHQLELETDPSVRRAVLGRAASRLPLLAELIEAGVR